MKNNKGYSFIELLICLAIMTALTAISFLTLGILNNARAKDVSSKLDSKIYELWVSTNAKSPNNCLVLDEESEGYVLKTGTYEGITFTADKDGAGNDIVEKLNDRIVIKYVSDSGVESSKSIIQYNKADGSVKNGAGTYYIYLRASDDNKDYSGKLMAKVVLNASTGSHYIE